MLWRDYEHTLNSPNWDSTAAKNKEILSTSSPPLTAPVEKLSSAFSVLKQMSTHFLAIRLKGWAMIILDWPWNMKSGEKVTEAPSSESGVALKHRLRKGMHSYVAFVYRSRYVGAKVNGHIQCDDYADGTFYEMSAGDFFKIYVRWDLLRRNFHTVFESLRKTKRYFQQTLQFLTLTTDSGFCLLRSLREITVFLPDSCPQSSSRNACRRGKGDGKSSSLAIPYLFD